MAPDGMLSFRPERDLHGRPLTQLRLSVTDHCNFRWPYSMPSDGPEPCFVAREELLSYEQLAQIVRLLVDLGVSRVRLTGGEPLLRADLYRLVRMRAIIPGLDDLSLTTNGYLLATQAEKLRHAGLQRLNISLDSLDEQGYQRLNGRDLSVERVLAGIAAAERAGFGPLKLNCVVIRGVNDSSVVDLARHFRGTPREILEGSERRLGRYATTDLAVEVAELQARVPQREQVLARHFGRKVACPFLNGKVITAAEAFSQSERIAAPGKAPLRAAAARLGLPAAIVQRPKKAAQYGSGAQKALRSAAVG